MSHLNLAILSPSVDKLSLSDKDFARAVTHSMIMENFWTAHNEADAERCVQSQLSVFETEGKFKSDSGHLDSNIGNLLAYCGWTEEECVEYAKRSGFDLVKRREEGFYPGSFWSYQRYDGLWRSLFKSYDRSKRLDEIVVWLTENRKMVESFE